MRKTGLVVGVVEMKFSKFKFCYIASPRLKRRPFDLDHTWYSSTISLRQITLDARLRPYVFLRVFACVRFGVRILSRLVSRVFVSLPRHGSATQTIDSVTSAEYISFIGHGLGGIYAR